MQPIEYSAEEALDNIFAGAAEQCDMVAAAVRNADADATAILHMAFEYLVRIVRAEAENGVSASAQRFMRSARAFERLGRDVSLSAFDIASAWTCPNCGDNVPGRLRIRGVRDHAPAVAVECAACNHAADVGPHGMERVRELFAEHLARGVARKGKADERPLSWNPRFNNFEWDGT